MGSLNRGIKNISPHRKAGFTLVELLVVLVILGLLAGIVGPQLIGHTDKANVQTTKTQIESLGAALDMFRLDMGRYPTAAEGLQALIDEPPGAERWKGPYLRKTENLPTDAWGNEFRYDSPGQHGAYDLYSLGADNTEGGEEDIVSWN